MGTFVLKRLAQTAITLLIVSIISFSLIQFIPGDPVYTMLGTEITKEYHDQVYHSMGLDLPLHEQYLNWFTGLFRGDMGYSYYYRKDVSTLIASRLPITLTLGITSSVISIFIGVFFGIITATHRGKMLDTGVTMLANVGVAMPIFWLIAIAIYLFAMKWRLLPSYGFTLPWVNFSKSMRQMVLPVFCMSLGGIASYTRQMRSSMLEVINQDYIRTARSKGLTEGVVLRRHAVKNALIPILTLAGITMRNCIGGSAIVETMFNIVGMGQIMVKSINNCDYQLLQSCLFFMAAITCLCNLFVDLAYGFVDPRARLK